MQYLFVYGTLAPDECNHHIMTPITGTWQRAFVKGVMDVDGFGLTGGYPALVFINQTTQTVQGWLFGSDDLPLHWESWTLLKGRRISVNVSWQPPRQASVSVPMCMLCIANYIPCWMYHLKKIGAINDSQTTQTPIFDRIFC